MDKGARDKLAGSRGENGGGYDAQKDLTQELEGMRQRRDGEKKWKEILKGWE
jgi:hypothetical protein